MKSKVLRIILNLFLIVACTQTERLRMGVTEFKSSDWALVEIDGFLPINLQAIYSKPRLSAALFV